MTNLANIVTHYLEQIAQRAKLSGFDEMHIEIMHAVEQDERNLERRMDELLALARGNSVCE